MARKKINEGILKKQVEMRVATALKIQEAINQIIEDGGIVTKKKLLELTGLSSAVFSKEHVKDLLKKNAVCQFKFTAEVKRENKYTDVLEKQYEDNVKLINRQISQIQDLKIAVKHRENDLTKKNGEIEELKKKNAMLLGKIHLILTEIDIKGYEKLYTGFDIL